MKGKNGIYNRYVKRIIDVICALLAIMANTNLESAASARPVITSNIYGCKEAVIDGKTGYLAKSKNAEDLYRAMKRFASLSYEERRTMGLAGRRHMEMLFDKQNVVSQTVQKMELQYKKGN